MKVKVYSRFENPVRFRFSTYSRATRRGGGVEVVVPSDDEIVELNGINEVVNHTRITLPHAVTVFSDEGIHDLKKRIYTLEDLERLKQDPTFKQMVKNGDLSIDTTDDLSRDLTGVGKLTDAELEERRKGQREEDASARLVNSRDVA